MEIGLVALKLLLSVSDKIPNFDQRVKENYRKALIAWELEFQKPEELIDDQELAMLRIKVEAALEAFEKELNK